jgi:hypothetical protein
MKSLLFYVFILLPSILFGQDDLKKSAEDFMKGYYKLFEEKKWNLVTETYAEDAQVVWMNGMVLSLYEMMKPVLEKNKTEMTSDKVDVKWILSDITGPNSVLVTTRYIETTDRTGNIRVTDNIGVYLLEQKNGAWKIKKWIPQQNLPLIYTENVDKKYQTGNTAAIFKAGNAINHGWVLILSMIEHFKNAGISPAESGKMIGARFAKTWDPHPWDLKHWLQDLIGDFRSCQRMLKCWKEIIEPSRLNFFHRRHTKAGM